MANTTSAAKRSRQTARRTLRNRRVLSQLHTFHKRTAAADKNGEANLRALISALDKAAKRGIIHRNAANRRKARLIKALRAPKK